VLEQHTLTRLTANPPPGPAAAREDGFAPVVLLAAAPAGHATAVRLAVLLWGTRLGVTGVLLGKWPHGQTWRVDPAGHTRPVQPATPTGTAEAVPVGAAGHVAARLCVLTATAAADLLTLTGQAGPGRAHPPAPAGAARPAGGAPGAGPALGARSPGADRPAEPAGDRPVPAPLRLRLLGAPAVYRADGTPVALHSGSSRPVADSSAAGVHGQASLSRRHVPSGSAVSGCTRSGPVLGVADQRHLLADDPDPVGGAVLGRLAAPVQGDPPGDVAAEPGLHEPAGRW
jgi:hypothetical protein